MKIKIVHSDKKIDKIFKSLPKSVQEQAIKDKEYMNSLYESQGENIDFPILNMLELEMESQLS